MDTQTPTHTDTHTEFPLVTGPRRRLWTLKTADTITQNLPILLSLWDPSLEILQDTDIVFKNCVPNRGNLPDLLNVFNVRQQCLDQI